MTQSHFAGLALFVAGAGFLNGACAQMPHIGALDLRGAMVIGAPGFPFPQAGYPGAAAMPTGNVKRLSDSSATCEALAAEATQLEQRQAQHMAKLNAAQAASQASSDAMMSAGDGGQAISTATGLLSMVPGVGMFAGIAGGIASTAASSAASARMQEQTSQMMRAQQEAADAGAAMATDQARRDYLVDLFLSRGCKLEAAKAGAAAPVPQ